MYNVQVIKFPRIEQDDTRYVIFQFSLFIYYI